MNNPAISMNGTPILPDIFYFDCHLGSTIEILADDLPRVKGAPNVWLGGDNIDMRNVAKKMVDYYKKLYLQLCVEHGDNLIPGNHEAVTTINKVAIKKGVFVMAHGDLEANPEKWTLYRMGKWGAGWFKRHIVVRFIKEAEEIIDRKLPEDFLKRASSLAKSLNVPIYIGGHFHPKKMIDVKYDGIRIIIMPRGKTEIYLPPAV